MTTTLDRGAAAPSQMLHCPLEGSDLYPTLVLALRDMRTANQRDETTGEGKGNASSVGLSIAMIVLDTLTGDSSGDVGGKWTRLLTAHGVEEDDARTIYALRCALLHGYGLPKPEHASGRTVLLTRDAAGYALDTSREGFALVSVPVFCGRLVERIAAAAWMDWDKTLINTDVLYLYPRR
jgi:hypothetical protein